MHDHFFLQNGLAFKHEHATFRINVTCLCTGILHFLQNTTFLFYMGIFCCRKVTLYTEQFLLSQKKLPEAAYQRNTGLKTRCLTNTYIFEPEKAAGGRTPKEHRTVI